MFIRDDLEITINWYWMCWYWQKIKYIVKIDTGFVNFDRVKNCTRGVNFNRVKINTEGVKFVRVKIDTGVD